MPSLDNNYLYYVIRDDNDKIRGHVIGVQHWVKPKDKNLNPRIVEAIRRSSKAVLEMPPNSRLLLKESSPDWVIDKIKRQFRPLVGRPVVKPILERRVNVELAKLQENTTVEGYEKAREVVEGLNSSEDKLRFLQEIQKNLFEFNLVSMEETLNEQLGAIEGMQIVPLEDIDLRALLDSARDELAQANIGAENPQLDVTQTEARQMELEKQLYKAWVKGDAVAIRQLWNDINALNPEPPPIDRIHASRDANMAKRIVEVVLQAKENDEETSIVLGCAHLVYSKRKNVIEYLDEQFRTDLSGWSITQVKAS